MGLIKTAMMTGGGIYAVNRLAKTAETRHNDRPADRYGSNPQYREQPSYPQRSRTPPQYQTSVQARGNDERQQGGNAPPGYWYSAEHDAYYPIPRATQGDKSNESISLSQRGYQEQGTINEQAVMPPPYFSRRGERAQSALSPSSRGDLAGQAIDFIMSAADGKRGNSGEGVGKRSG
ncbi:MAG: hypothetical protein ALECFALPRED_004978 [Alectoria fallacina]|uniref:Uncharacterized protein n=1 Tax=Alectoria fallacina TaxID=1903189 RepID=A0A8H3IXP9_9LECA|nr:MAG: hypothetical protein ALECFALPRED_004978 [Alectoria fallacina]